MSKNNFSAAYKQAGVAVADTKITLGNDVPISWRQNIVNVKAFLTMMWNDHCEPPGAPCSMDVEGGDRRTLEKNVGSVYAAYLYLSPKWPCVFLCDRESKEARDLYLNVLWKRH